MVTPGCMNATMCGQWLPDEISATQWGSNEQVNPPAQGGAQLEFLSDLAPSTIVYVGGTAIPLSSYQTNYGKYLWIESKGLRQYMSIPQYSSSPLMAYTSTGGPGEILEMFPSESNQGTYLKTYYNFNPGYNRILYRGDVAGRHYLLFSQNDESSNAIIIDVDYGMIGGSPVLGTMPS